MIQQFYRVPIKIWDYIGNGEYKYKKKMELIDLFKHEEYDRAFFDTRKEGDEYYLVAKLKQVDKAK